MPMRRGVEASERDSRSSVASRLQFLTFKQGDDELHIVRFLDDLDQWPVVDVHISVPTKPVPNNRKKMENFKWPSNMGATCQNDIWFRIEDADGQATDEYEQGYGHCYIHENYTDRMNPWGRPYSNSTASTFARVVLRERTDDGRVRDVTEEWIAPDGTKKIVPAIRVISQQWAKFFAAIKAGAHEDRRVCTKDYTIKRSGKDFAIGTYSITPDHHPAYPRDGVEATDSWKIYDDAVKLMDAELEPFIRRQASEEWYRLWFIPGPWDDEPIETESPGAGTAVAEGGESPDGALTDDEAQQMEEMRKRLLAQRAKS